MARHGKHRRRLNRIVILLAGLLILFCVLRSVEDKGGPGLGLPDGDIPFLDSVGGFFSGLPGNFSLPDGEGDAVPVTADGTLEVHFLDVGQGKSILIRAGGENALIDVGENGQGPDVISYLRRQNVRRIDILIGTHPHSDHIGDMDEIIEAFDIGRIILPEIPEKITPTSQTYTDMLMAIGKKGLKITVAEPGEVYRLGDAELQILGPVREYGDLNNISVVTWLRFGDTGFLFTGDTEAEAEADIVAARPNIYAKTALLDVGHHGSKTSSSDEFIRWFRPDFAVISCGVDNSYGHPHQTVTERLAAAGAEIFRTDFDGTVVAVSDGETLEIHIQK